MTTAETLARRVHPDPSPAFIESVAADDELMAVAADDLDAAAQMLVDLAIETVTAAVAITRDAMKKEAA